MTGRTLFFHIPFWQQALFYVFAGLACYSFWLGFHRRWKLWQQGKPSTPAALPFRLEAIYRLAFRGSKNAPITWEPRRVPVFASGMHIALVAGLAMLLVGTTIVAIEHYGSWIFGVRWFYRGYFYLLMKIVLDLAGIAVLVGLLAASIVSLLRQLRTNSTHISDLLFLLLAAATAATGFLLEGAGIAADASRANAAIFSPIGRVFALHSLGTLYPAIWWMHIFLVLTFIALLPQSRWKHLLFIPWVAWLQPERAPTALEPGNEEELEARGTIGLGSLQDFTSYQLMSLDACVECGRCTTICPPHLAGSDLNPMQMVVDLRNLLTNQGISASTDALPDSALWACTNCHACVQICPARIRHVDIINGIRRYRTAEGRVPTDVARTLRNLASRGNPWGAPASSAIRPDIGFTGVPDVVFWIGCSGAFDPDGQRVVSATAALLHRAGVRFVIAGPLSHCSGDPARRLGDEFQYLEMAKENIASLQALGTKRIVTQCPHCLNTLKNEYPLIAPHSMQVLHHTELLAELVESNLLKVQTQSEQAIVFHDPCFLARGAQVTAAPRKLLRVINQNTTPEAKQNSACTQCCGAGGGRMWQEDKSPVRPADLRLTQLTDTGANTIATGCPFCNTMLKDAARRAEMADQQEIRVLDAAELLLEAISPTIQEQV